MTKEKMERISELTRISRVRELTDEEKSEREVLRREYIDSYKRSLVANLENTYIVDAEGNKTKVHRRSEKNG